MERWGEEAAVASVSGVPVVLGGVLDEATSDALQMRLRIDELTRLLLAAAGEQEAAVHFRPPSPPPEYDNRGRRVNTRAARAREALQLERQEWVQRASKRRPGFVPPAGYRAVSVKRQKKVFLPVDKYPDYNFTGLIIGPRGETHKQLEQESGARLYIRGRGSGKEGSQNPSDLEPLHVLILAEDDATLDRAAAMIERLIVPIDDEVNDHKQLQLRKLAIYNGTVRDDSRNFLRNRRQLGLGVSAKMVVCDYCGDASHPSADCPHRKAGQPSKLDIELQEFLGQLGDATPPRTPLPADAPLPEPSSASSASSSSAAAAEVDAFLAGL